MRRLEQKRGACIDEGYITFFEGDPRQRPAVFLWPLVDIDPATGVETILHPDYHQSMGMAPYFEVLAAWVARFGVPDAQSSDD